VVVFVKASLVAPKSSRKKDSVYAFIGPRCHARVNRLNRTLESAALFLPSRSMVFGCHVLSDDHASADEETVG